MKVWTYYANPSKVFPRDEDRLDAAKEYGTDTDILYAMTDNKEYAKKFRETRNMSVFNEIKLNLNDFEWNILLSDNRDCYLEYKELTTRRRIKDKSFPEEYTTVNVLLTFLESVDIDDNASVESIVINSFSDIMSPLGLLDVALTKNLFKLHYWDFLNIARLSECHIDTMLAPWTDTDEYLLDIIHEAHMPLKVDELEYFIVNYGHTLAG